MTEMLPGFAEDPDELVWRNRQRWNPIKTYCLFSGGNDSTVLADRMHGQYDELVWLDTGTAVPGVEEFVHEYAGRLDVPLRIMRHNFDAFRFLVLGGTDPEGHHWFPLGFPGKGMHPRAFERLKERLIEKLIRETKEGHHRNAAVQLISGIRRDESQRRATRAPLTEKGSAKFCNPLIDWSNQTMRDYRRNNNLPQSDPAALCGRSMECQCGSYGNQGERDELAQFFPETWEGRIMPIEREAIKRGLKFCHWGLTPPDVKVPGSEEFDDTALCGPGCGEQLELAA